MYVCPYVCVPAEETLDDDSVVGAQLLLFRRIDVLSGQGVMIATTTGQDVNKGTYECIKRRGRIDVLSGQGVMIATVCSCANIS